MSSYKDLYNQVRSVILEIEQALQDYDVDENVRKDIEKLVYSKSQTDYSLTTLLDYLSRSSFLESIIKQ